MHAESFVHRPSDPLEGISVLLCPRSRQGRVVGLHYQTMFSFLNHPEIDDKSFIAIKFSHLISKACYEIQSTQISSQRNGSGS